MTGLTAITLARLVQLRPAERRAALIMAPPITPGADAGRLISAESSTIQPGGLIRVVTGFLRSRDGTGAGHLAVTGPRRPAHRTLAVVRAWRAVAGTGLAVMMRPAGCCRGRAPPRRLPGRPGRRGGLAVLPGGRAGRGLVGPGRR